MNAPVRSLHEDVMAGLMADVKGNHPPFQIGRVTTGRTVMYLKKLSIQKKRISQTISENWIKFSKGLNQIVKGRLNLGTEKAHTAKLLLLLWVDCAHTPSFPFPAE